MTKTELVDRVCATIAAIAASRKRLHAPDLDDAIEEIVTELKAQQADVRIKHENGRV